MPVPRQPWTCDSLSCMNGSGGARLQPRHPEPIKTRALATEGLLAFSAMTDEGPKPNASSSTRILKKHTMKKGDVFKRTCHGLLSAYWPKSVEVPMKSKTEAKNTAKKKPTTRPPVPPKALPSGLRKKQGVWFFSTGQPTTAAHLERLRQSIYRERENRFLGLAKPRLKPKAKTNRRVLTKGPYL
jgi:hypothetical protein